MTDCHVCRRHHPTPDGDCTDACRHRPATIGHLCDGCHLRILRDLTTIETAWVLSADGAVVTGRGGRGSNERSLPGGTEWLNWREGSELVGNLRAIAETWHEMMNPETHFPNSYVLDLIQWLRMHLQHTGSQHSEIATTAQELQEWAQTARRIIGDIPTGQIIACPGIVEPCGRRLRVDVAQPEAEVYCRGCATTWTTGRLLLHGVSGEADAWLDAEAIEAATGVQARTLQRWAKRGLIRRGATGQYHIGDVQQARHGAAAAAG